MLEKLGSGLKSALKKIANAGYIDKNAVDELAKDIQRTLLSSDVDVKLVFELTERIKKRSLEEKPKTGMTAREHIVNIVYEELVNFVGKKPEIMIRPGRILFIGLFGSGKCVHPDSVISLNDGRMISAEELYKEYASSEKQLLEDGELIDISNKELFVPSFNPNNMKMEKKKVTHLWKLIKKDLLNVYLDNGNDFSVRVTPEHPFFAMRHGQVVKMRADMLNEDDYVAVPKTHGYEHRQVPLLKYLRNLDFDVYVSQEESKKLMNATGNTLKSTCQDLKYARNYCKFTVNIKNGRIPIHFIDENQSFFKLKLKYAEKLITFPGYLTSDLSEFLGYLFGDGHLESSYVEITNQDQEIINRVKELSESLFSLKPSVKRDFRTKSMYRMRLSSITLVHIINKVFGMPIGKKGKHLRTPQQICESNKDVIRSFLRAYFDCDGHPSKEGREIEIVSESRDMILSTNLLLRRFGIVGSMSRKNINGVSYWRLIIGARHAEIYAEHIGFIIKSKMQKALGYKKIGLTQGCGKRDMIPLGCMLKESRESMGFSIGEIQNACNSYGQYERKGLISRESLAEIVSVYDKQISGIHLRFLNVIKNDANLLRNEFSKEAVNSLLSYYISEDFIENNNGVFVLTQKAVKFLENIERANNIKTIEYLKVLSESDVCWLRVSKTENIKNEGGFVYDLTIEDNHSFIADGIIVHNTTSIGKLARFYQKKGLKPALIGCDIHRPAAMDQLMQIAEQLGVPCYAPKDIKDASIIAKNGAEQFKKYDILIFDSSGRDALDVDLAQELKKLGETIKADEVILAIPADLGQAAGKQASEFKKLVGITGIFITKLDGTARGGGAITACSVTGAPVKFIGTGEKLDALEVFDPERFISRLIGFGDLQSLIEKATEAIDPKKAQKMTERLSSGKFTMDDFYEQLQSMGKMGSLKSVLDMMPGMGGMKLPKNVDLNKQEGKMKKWKYVIESMTKQEREDPEVIDASRIKRISKGSGTQESDVRELLKNFEQSKKMMKMMGGGNLKRGSMAKLARKFKGFG